MEESNLQLQTIDSYFHLRKKNIMFNYLYTYILYGNMIKYWQNPLLINEKFQIEN